MGVVGDVGDVGAFVCFDLYHVPSSACCRVHWSTGHCGQSTNSGCQSAHILNNVPSDHGRFCRSLSVLKLSGESVITCCIACAGVEPDIISSCTFVMSSGDGVHASCKAPVAFHTIRSKYATHCSGDKNQSSTYHCSCVEVIPCKDCQSLLFSILVNLSLCCHRYAS